ncbi:spermidine/putrescine-binding periplasmic protein potD [Halodesulfurarchaeum formicicum]|uniref:Spermidine/putrescine-binding periplasmic protein potD n=1 Tax=Halodesulfurarchaeum formicicum TaxID=1873524 RepID=A0A1D8S218_9EURY|nr:spermidine/putrescine-binding periplasmic protein potD [Halodesulfurarchaeum formicicum]
MAGCLGGSSGSEDIELDVAVWAGTYAERFEEVVAKGYEEETGVTVNVSPAGGEILSQLQAASDDDPPYDVVSADELYYHLGVNDGLYNELRPENVPNLENVYSFLKEKPGQGMDYGVPTDGELLGIAYDAEAMSGADWEQMQETDDNTGFEGVFYVYPMMIAALLSDARPGIEELYHEEDHSAVFEEMEALANNVDIWTGSAAEIFNGIEQGIITHAMWYSGMAYAEADVNENISVTIPERTGGYVNNYCTVSGTDHREEGEKFLNYMLRPEVQTEWAETGYNFMANKNAEHPGLTAEAYPSSNDELESINFVNFDRLGDLQSDLSGEFDSIK